LQIDHKLAFKDKKKSLVMQWQGSHRFATKF
jgi:hypothetical protein